MLMLLFDDHFVLGPRFHAPSPASDADVFATPLLDDAVDARLFARLTICYIRRRL